MKLSSISELVIRYLVLVFKFLVLGSWALMQGFAISQDKDKTMEFFGIKPINSHK
jgi:hypothetical protein